MQFWFLCSIHYSFGKDNRANYSIMSEHDLKGGVSGNYN